MGLKIHLAARSDELLAELRPALATARAKSVANATGIPRPLQIMVPSAQIGDWLQVRLARDLGLSMGFEFAEPGRFLSRFLAPGDTPLRFAESQAYWTPEQLRWRLLPAVDGVATHVGSDAAQSLAPRDRFAFAELIAQQFDRYGRYRPDWLLHWQKGQLSWRDELRQPSPAATADEAWQRELWRALASAPDAPPHPTLLIQQLGELAVATDQPAVPLFIVGMNQLDPLFLRTLNVLARRNFEIALYVLLPSLGYLGDLPRRDAVRSRLAATDRDAAMEEGGHPLLASLGQQAIGQFQLLETLSPDYGHWPDVADDHAVDEAIPLLRQLQQDIRQQRPPMGPPASIDEIDFRPTLLPTDRSLRIHCCHSPRRELEVLRDELLRAFAELPGLKPDEVVVAVTDFDVYAPLAEGILRSGSAPLRVRLTAIPAREANPIAGGLLALLRLALGRFTTSEVIELLDLAAVQHHLGLAAEPDQMSRLADALRDSGLTFGLDAADRASHESTGTWRAALDRHLAGTWFGPYAGAVDAAGECAHPLASDLASDEEALLRFMAWLTQLAIHLHEWRQPASASTWATRLEKTIDELLHSEAHDDHAAAVRRMLGELASVSADTPLDAGTLLDWLQPQLDNATSLRTSMGGEILFGRIDQVYGLPCRVLAVLGLQDGAFPRTGRRPSWDLLTATPRRGDPDPRTQDRQWFLDCLLNPADRLMLSAANRSLRTAHDGPLSSCVEELLRAAVATVRVDEGASPVVQQLVVQHRIQPFASDYFVPSGTLPRSFDPQAARIAGDLAANTVDDPHPFYSPPLLSAEGSSAPPTFSISELTRFWQAPARAWLRHLQLEVNEGEEDDTGLDSSPVSLNPLQVYEVRSAALSTRLPEAALEVAVTHSRLMANRGLPPGALGRLAWERCDEEVATLATTLSTWLPQMTRASVKLNLPGQHQLTGQVMLVGAEGSQPIVLVYRPGNYDKATKYQLDALVQTAAAALHLGRAVGCRVLGLDDIVGKDLSPLSVIDAAKLMADLVAGFTQGQTRPLCFGPQTSHALQADLVSGKPDWQALDSARSAWSKEPTNEQAGGEGTTRAGKLAWRDRDPFDQALADDWLNWATRISGPLSRWWQGTAMAPVGPAANLPGSNS